MTPTSMPKGSPLFTRSDGTAALDMSAPAFAKTALFWSFVSVTAIPTSKPVMPRGAVGVNGLYDNAAAHASENRWETGCLRGSAFINFSEASGGHGEQRC